MTPAENIIVEAEGGIVRITINRPTKLNALNRQTLSELSNAIYKVEHDDTVRVVVITGAGEKSFVAGADIAEMQNLTPAEAADFARLGHRTFGRLAGLDPVVIAEVNGYALGGGCELMLACDFAIASENARFGLPEVKLGVMPGFGGTIRLARRVGGATAKQLLFTGEQIKAQEAQRLGLVNDVVPASELRAKVDEVAGQIVKNAPKAVAWAKRSARIAEESDMWVAAAFEQEVFGMCFSTSDQKEGMTAFIERREAHWSGR